MSYPIITCSFHNIEQNDLDNGRPYYHGQKIPLARFFPFCGPENEPQARVIEIVSKQLSSDKADTITMLRDLIIKALKNDYPRKKTNQN